VSNISFCVKHFFLFFNTAIADNLGAADRFRLWLQRMMMDDGNNHGMATKMSIG